MSPNGAEGGRKQDRDPKSEGVGWAQRWARPASGSELQPEILRLLFSLRVNTFVIGAQLLSSFGRLAAVGGELQHRCWSDNCGFSDGSTQCWLIATMSLRDRSAKLKYYGWV